MADYYKAEDVRHSVPVRKYLKDRGVKVRGNRCVAVWRGGDNLTCSIHDATGENCVFDHKQGERLGVIDLCMRIEGRSFPDALSALGERYGVPAADGSKCQKRKPKPKVVPNWVRVQWLIVHADDDALMSDALLHLNEGGDYLTDADLYWARHVAAFIQRGISFDDAIRISAEMCRQLTAKEAV